MCAHLCDQCTGRRPYRAHTSGTLIEFLSGLSTVEILAFGFVDGPNKILFACITLCGKTGK